MLLQARNLFVGFARAVSFSVNGPLAAPLTPAPAPLPPPTCFLTVPGFPGGGRGDGGAALLEGRGGVAALSEERTAAWPTRATDSAYFFRLQKGEDGGLLGRHFG